MKKILLFYGAIAFILIAPLLNGTCIFTLDSVPILNQFKLHELFYGKIAPDYGGNLIFHFINGIFPAQIFQKLLIFFILLLSAFSAYRLIPGNSYTAKLFAGILYMMNPYTYIRIIVGHWHILFAYAVLPLALKTFIELLEKRTRKDMLKFAFFLTLIGFNVHTLVISMIAMGVIFIFWFMHNRDIRAIKNVSVAGMFFVLLSAYWLAPLATSGELMINDIGSQDINVFSPRIDSFSALFTLASMHGFWRSGYIYAKDFIPFWQALFAIILFLAVHGFITYYRDEKIGIYVKSFAVISIAGLILAAGIQSPFSEAFRWLFDHTLLKGMRDSHKFVTLLVLSYAYLGALGIAEFEKVARETARDRKKYAAWCIVAMALIVPLIYSFTFLTGFEGQLKPGDYPDDWYEVNRFLNMDEQDFKVLFLPWHQKMDFHWVKNKDKRIENPAYYFFDKEVISGRNIEIGSIYRQISSPDQLYIDLLLDNSKNITTSGNLVAPLDIKYILLTKEADYKNYFFLFNQTDLELVKETENFYVFRNRHEVAKIYGVKNVTFITGWEELIQRSRSEDITQSLYLIGNASNEAPGLPGKIQLEYEKKSPVEYELKENTSTGYIVFTEPYSESWELEGKKPAPAYGVVNAYEAGGQGMRYERFYRIYLPAYIISLFTLIELIIFYFKQESKQDVQE